MVPVRSAVLTGGQTVTEDVPQSLTPQLLRSAFYLCWKDGLLKGQGHAVKCLILTKKNVPSKAHDPLSLINEWQKLQRIH